LIVARDPKKVADCIFCDIVRRNSPASFVYADDVCSAFMDIRPVNTGHVLVIPNQHSSFLAELPCATGAKMFNLAQRIAQALRDSGVRCDGVNLFLADGEAAFQEVFHVHLHVIPRYWGDGFRLVFPHDYADLPQRSRLDQIAANIVNVLRAD
jgi:histidine triad (HIT) family protein